MLALKKSLLNLQVNRALHNVRVRRESMSYNKAIHTAIIFSAGDSSKHDLIKKFQKMLEKDGKRVDVLSFLGKNQENHEFLFDYFRDEDVSIWGQFKSEIVTRFLEKPYDFLFHIDLEPNRHIDHVLAKSVAKCRIGPFREKKIDFYEMMVKTENNSIDELINQIYHYTRSLI